jgi:GNAT superfamily N-acetyltransferase
MEIKIVPETPDVLTEYEKVSIAFRVRSAFSVELVEKGLGGIKLVENKVTPPFIKNYDDHESERPSQWAKRFDISNWGIFSAFVEEKRVGGAAVALGTPEVLMLEGHEDLACLWDLRVAPEFRGKGIGHYLFLFSRLWAKENKCRLLKVETQNINVPACRFYARQGFRLGGFNRYAYPESLNEIQLLWYLRL